MRQGERGGGGRGITEGELGRILFESRNTRILFIFATYLWSSYEIPLVFFQWTDKLAKIIILKTSSKRVARFLLSERGERKKGEREREKEDRVSFLTNERTRVA